MGGVVAQLMAGNAAGSLATDWADSLATFWQYLESNAKVAFRMVKQLLVCTVDQVASEIAK